MVGCGRTERLSVPVSLTLDVLGWAKLETPGIIIRPFWGSCFRIGLSIGIHENPLQTSWTTTSPMPLATATLPGNRLLCICSLVVLVLNNRPSVSRLFRLNLLTFTAHIHRIPCFHRILFYI